MATYIVTTANWDSPAFWSGISESAPGHTIDFSGLPSSYDVDFWPDGDRIEISDGTSTFTIGDSDFGGTPDATMGGSTQLEYFTTIDGSQGSDILDGGNSDDTIFGNAGADTIYGNGGNDSIDGGDRSDTVYGGSGDDLITDSGGSSSDDTIYGEGGNDTISGGVREDLLDGGADADTFILEDDFGNDTIIGGEDGIDDDTVDLSGLSNSVTVTFTDEEMGTISDGVDTITFSEIENLILTDQDDSVDASATWAGLTGDEAGVDVDAGDGSDTIIGGRGGDTIDGGVGDDSITGDYGDDSLSGGEGTDTILGGDGNETIDGGDGDDYIDAGEQADTVFGGDGADTIVAGTGDDFIDGGGGDDSITGGFGDDSLSGEDGNDTFVYASGGGNDTITDFNTGNTGTLNDGDSTNNDFIDLSSFYDDIGELHADQADDGLLNQSNDGVDGADYSDNTSFGSGSLTFTGASADNSSFTSENTGVVCFTIGTAILTPRGEVLIEELRIGDLVITADNGPQPIRWIGKRTLDHQALYSAPNLRPVLFKADVLENERPLLVSPQHCMMVGKDTLARAKHLAEKMPGVRVANGKRSVCYVHLMFDAHQIIFAEGSPSESFFPGPMSLTMMGNEARDELFSIFPELHDTANRREETILRYGEPARAIVSKHAVRELLAKSLRLNIGEAPFAQARTG